MKQEELQKALFALQDEKFREMQIGILPNVPSDTIIGVRTPELRRLSKEMEDGEAFKKALPHTYFEENQVHSFLLERGRDFAASVSSSVRLMRYLPVSKNIPIIKE